MTTSDGSSPGAAPPARATAPGTQLTSGCQTCAQQGPCDVVELELANGDLLSRKLRTTVVRRGTRLEGALAQRARFNPLLRRNLDSYDIILECTADYPPRTAELQRVRGKARWIECTNGCQHWIVLRERGAGEGPPTTVPAPTPLELPPSTPVLARRRLEQEHAARQQQWQASEARRRQIEETPDMAVGSGLISARHASEVEAGRLAARAAAWERLGHHREGLGGALDAARALNPLYAVFRYCLLVTGEALAEVRELELITRACGVRPADPPETSTPNGTLRGLVRIYRKSRVAIKFTSPAGFVVGPLGGRLGGVGAGTGGALDAPGQARLQAASQAQTGASIEIKVNGDDMPEGALLTRVLRGVDTVSNVLNELLAELGRLPGIRVEVFGSVTFLRGTLEVELARIEEERAIELRLLPAPVVGNVTLGLTFIEAALNVAAVARLTVRAAEVSVALGIELKGSIGATARYVIGPQDNHNINVEGAVEIKIEATAVASLRGYEVAVQGLARSGIEGKVPIKSEKGWFEDSWELTRKPGTITARVRAMATQWDVCTLTLWTERKWPAPEGVSAGA